MKAKCLKCFVESELSPNQNIEKMLWCFNCSTIRYFQYVPTSVVVLMCDNSYYDVDKVEFISIEEDMTGRDIITFQCPKCGEVQRSLILG